MRDRGVGRNDGFQSCYVTSESGGFQPRARLPGRGDLFRRDFLQRESSHQGREAGRAAFYDSY